MASPPRWALMCLFPVLSLVALGCRPGDRPELGQVRGTVTLDGKPLAGVIVRFFPATGRAATATTASDGRYELVYTHGVQGSKVGPTTVSFAWPDGEAGSAPIPDKYGAQSELTVEVKPGDNTFDFTLESK